MKTMIVGNGGREAILAKRMAEHSTLFAFMAHMNPSILEYVEHTGGGFATGNPSDPKAVADFAEQNQIDMVMVSADDPLSNGVVDEIMARGIKVVGPTKEGAEIEWNKEFSRQLIADVAPEANPFHRIAHSNAEIDAIFAELGNMEVVIKPRGLTGGKGVKVQGPHLADHAEAAAYAKEVLADSIGGGAAVLIEEKIEGVEITLQCITDGKTVIFPPTTYDYPYRYEGDTGPGTGGMGTYSCATKELPFMTAAQYAQAQEIVQKVSNKLNEMGRHFNGILYGSFFLTKDGGIKVVEFNGRFGDPESLNILTVLESSWVDIMQKITTQALSEDDIKWKKEASVVIYLVSPDYALRTGAPYQFRVDINAIRAADCDVYFSSSIHLEDGNYETVGQSRCVAVVASAPTLQEAYDKVADAIDEHVEGALEWRRDIACDIEKTASILGVPAQAA